MAWQGMGSEVWSGHLIPLLVRGAVAVRCGAVRCGVVCVVLWSGVVWRGALW